MKNLLIKLLVVMFLSSSLLLFSQEYETGVSFDARVKAENLGEGAGFVDSGNNIDDLTVSFSARVDNVFAKLEFDDGDGEVLDFSSSYIEVSDLIDGLLTVRFFDIGYGQGTDNSILPDVGLHGIKLTFNPIDILSVYVGYGLGSATFRGATELKEDPTDPNDVDQFDSLADLDNSGTSRDGNLKSQVHGISAGVTLTTDFVDVTVAGGGLLFEDAPNWIEPGTSGADALNSENWKPSTLALANVGLSVDALKIVAGGLLNIEYGIAIAGAFTIDAYRGFVDGEEEDTADANLDMVVIAKGGTGDLIGDFALDYYLHFSPDSATKNQTLGNLEDNFLELLKLKLTPSYTLAQFKFGLEVVFDIFGGEQARFKNLINTTTEGPELVSPLGIEVKPFVTWTPASGFGITFYYKYAHDDIGGAVADSVTYNDDKPAYDDLVTGHELGMEVKASFSFGN